MITSINPITRHKSRNLATNTSLKIPSITITSSSPVLSKIRNEIGLYKPSFSLSVPGISSSVSFSQSASQSNGNLKFKEFEQTVQKKAQKNAKRCSLKIIQLKRRGMEGKLISSIRDKIPERTKANRCNTHLKNKLWLSSINPVRATILNVYKKNQQKYFEFYKIFNLFKQGLLSLSLQIYFQFYCKDMLSLKFRIICDDKKIKQHTMLQNEINYIDELIDGRLKSRNISNSTQNSFIKNTFKMGRKNQNSSSKNDLNISVNGHCSSLSSINLPPLPKSNLSLASTDFSSKTLQNPNCSTVDKGDGYKGVERMVVNKIQRCRNSKQKVHKLSRSLFNADQFMYLTKDQTCNLVNKSWSDFKAAKEQEIHEPKVEDQNQQEKHKYRNVLKIFKNSMRHAIVKTKKGSMGRRGENIDA